jgi:hypothetical protein
MELSGPLQSSNGIVFFLLTLTVSPINLNVFHKFIQRCVSSDTQEAAQNHIYVTLIFALFLQF